MYPLIIGTMLAMVQDSGALVVRLGNDTVSLERYTVSASQVKGDYLIRTPRSSHRLYTLDLNPDGSHRRLEIVIHNISGAPGPAEIRQSIELVGDSAIVTVPRGDSTVTTRIATPRGTILWQIYVWGLVEQIGRQARAAGTDSFPITGVTFGLSGLANGVVRKKGGDTLQLAWTQGSLAGLGPFTFRLDPAGRLVWLTGKSSTVQVDVDRVPSVNLGAAGQAFAQRSLGQLSPRDTARAAIAGAEVWVDYSRPSRRGRDIYGSLVPWNTIWRTGANAATQLSTSVALTIGGAAVPAGKYTLWTLPSPTGWKLIVNKQTGQWGTSYDPAQDLVRVDAKVETIATPVEQFTIAFESGSLTLTWDKTRVSVPLSKK